MSSPSIKEGMGPPGVSRAASGDPIPTDAQTGAASAERRAEFARLRAELVSSAADTVDSIRINAAGVRIILAALAIAEGRE